MTYICVITGYMVAKCWYLYAALIAFRMRRFMSFTLVGLKLKEKSVLEGMHEGSRLR